MTLPTSEKSLWRQTTRTCWLYASTIFAVLFLPRWVAAFCVVLDCVGAVVTERLAHYQRQLIETQKEIIGD